jgi:outer membrane protein assembly factor BamB
MLDRQLGQVLTKATAAIAAKDYPLAVELLGPVVSGDLKALDFDLDVEQFSQDYFLPARKDQPARSSLKREAWRLLSSIPAKELAAFETQYGAEADLLLKQGLQEGSAEKLAEVVRRFFFTKAGYTACVTLGRYQLELGNPLAAIVYLKRVVQLPQASSRVEPEASLLLAGAYLHAREPERARSTIANLQKVIARPTITSRTGATLEFVAEKDPLPLLEQLFGRVPPESQPPVMQQWNMFRGNLARNGSTTISEPLSTPRWSVPVLLDREDEQTIAAQTRSYTQLGMPSLPSLQPLAVRDLILYRSLNRLVAIDFATGKRVWEHHWLTPGASNFLPPLGTNHHEQLRERMWLHAPYGQLSSDGEFVFVVEPIHEAAPTGNVNRPFAAMRQGGIGPVNHLVAVSMAKQGSLVWSVGGRSGEHEPQLQNAYFLSPPLVVNGQLYLLAEMQSAIVLVALDRLSGKLQWKQVLVASEAWYTPRQSQRHITGATLAYADGMLVCPTSAGVVVGVDLVNRSLAWATVYDRGSETNRRNSYLSRTALPYGEGWLDSSATLSQGRVLLTPPESNGIHCLDLFSGELIWSKKREEALFVAGVQQNTALLVGKKHLSGLNLQDGKKVWDDVPIATPSGRGLMDAHYYLQPTANRTLVKCEIATGKVVAEYATAQPLGNLIPYAGQVISLSAQDVASFHRYDQLETQVQQMLVKSPTDPWATARLGELQLHRKEYQAAYHTLRQALAHPPVDTAVNALLVSAGLALLEQNFQQHQGLADEIAGKLNSTPQRERFHRAVAIGKEKLGDHAGAMESLIQLSQVLSPSPENSALTTDIPLVEIERNCRVRNTRWIAAQAERLYRAAKAEERVKIDELLLTQRKQLPADSLVAARDFLELVGFHPLTDELRFKVIERLQANGNRLEAELLLQPLLVSANPTTAAQASAWQVKLLAAANRWSAAAAAANRLLRDHPQGEVLPGTTAAQLMAELEKATSFRAAQSLVQRTYPAGRVDITEDEHSVPDDSNDSRQQLHLCRWLQENEQLSTSLHAIYNASEESLLIRDSYGQTVLLVALKGNASLRASFRSDPFGSRPSNVVAYQVRMLGHLLILSTGSEILAFDALRMPLDAESAILWRHSLVDPHEDSDSDYYSTTVTQNPWGMSRVSITKQRTLVGNSSPLNANGFCFFRNRQLVCVDPITGETLWQRYDVLRGSELLGDDDFIYAAVPESTKVRVYRLRDGSYAGERTIALAENRIALHGSRVLSWSQAPSKNMLEPSTANIELKLEDLRDNREVWSEAAPVGSRGYLINSHEVALLRTDGKFTIRSLRNDKRLFEAQLERDEKIKQLVVLRSSEQFYVFVSQPEVNRLPRAIITPAPRPGNSNEVDAQPFAVLMSAKIYAFHRATGTAVWPVPAIISEMGLPMEQPLDQPVLALLRNVDSNSGGNASKRTASMLLLDKRTGGLIHRDDALHGEISGYQWYVDPDRPMLKLELPQKTFTLKFTNEPAPPQPPLQSDEAFVIKKGLSNAALRIFNGIFPQPPPRPEPDDPFE